MADRIDWEQHAATAQHDWSAAEQRKNDELTQLRAEIVRLRTAGDALAAIVGDVVVPYDDESKARTMVTAYDTWQEARREQ